MGRSGADTETRICVNRATIYVRSEYRAMQGRQDAQGVTIQRPATHRTETLFIRNYDVTWSYDLDVTVVDSDGDVVFDDRFYLRPGETVSEHDVIGDGTYDVTAVLDNRRSKTGTCEVGDGPDETILVELGNGIVSVTEGLYGATHAER